MFSIVASAVVLVCVLLFVGLFLIGAAVVGVLLWKRRNSAAALVPAVVRRALNDDLSEATKRQRVMEVKRAWMESDGYEVSE